MPNVPTVAMLRRGHGVSGRALNAEIRNLICYRSPRTNAQLQADSTIAIAPPAGTKKPIYIFSPRASGLDAVLPNYKAKIAYSPYWHSTTGGGFDSGTGVGTPEYENGRYDGNADADWNTYLNGLSSTAVTAAALDWEGVPNCTYGVSTMYQPIGGRGSGTAENTARNEAINCVRYAKSKRPNLIWGYYYSPCPLTSELYQWAVNNATAASWSTLAANGLPVNRECDALYISCYMRAVQGTTPSFTAGATDALTSAQAIKWQSKSAELALKSAEATGWAVKVFPFVSWTYYLVHGGSSNITPAPLSWGYTWHKALADTVWNGHQIDGLYIWDQSGSSPLTESELKVTYQALNGLPFDPNMPRP